MDESKSDTLPLMMNRFVISLVCLCVTLAGFATQSRRLVVADSITRRPLPSASVFDSRGNLIGMTDRKGRVPYAAADTRQITVRYLGYQERTITKSDCDTIFMSEYPLELPEVIVSSKQHKVLHVLAYVREYSSLSTYTDTVSLFREKMVDYMLVPDKDVKFKGWQSPRVLKSNSYYRFTNTYGLDSVSNACRHHFTWADWIKILPSPTLPKGLRNTGNSYDTVMGKYSPTELWTRSDDRIIVDVDVLADTAGRKWVTNLSGFFRNHLDYENFRVRYSYDNVIGDSIDIADISGYSFNIDSNGRGRDMFRFNRIDEPFFVSTYGEAYILDKEFITVKEARKWAEPGFCAEDMEIIEPASAPELQESVKTLIARVNAINHDEVRLDFVPDRRLAGRPARQQNLAERAFSLLKQLTGISLYKARKNSRKNWKQFQKEQYQRNSSKPFDAPGN